MSFGGDAATSLPAMSSRARRTSRSRASWVSITISTASPLDPPPPSCTICSIDTPASLKGTRQAGQDAKAQIVRLKAQIVTRPHLLESRQTPRLHLDGAGRRARKSVSTSARHVEDVRHNAHGRRHVTRATAGQEAWTKRATLQCDGVQNASDISERRIAPYHRRMDAELYSFVAIARDGEMLDHEAEAFGEAVVNGCHAADPLRGHALRLDADTECNHGEDH